MATATSADERVRSGYASGTFIDGPFTGLRYATASHEGVIGADGTFAYQEGETVTFSIDELIVGLATGAPELTVVDLAAAQPGTKLIVPGISNRARFLQSFASEPDLRSGVSITRAQADAVARHVHGIDFDVDDEAFAQNPAVVALFAELGLRLRGQAEARNHLRRALHGIRLLRDVEIPTRDGSFLSADVYLPIDEETAPTVMRLSVYGKAFGQGSAVTPDEERASEEREDYWFEGDRSTIPGFGQYFENIASAGAHDWVPRGYAVVRVDGRGIGKTPGTVSPFSLQEAEDYYDAIQWAAAQPWSDGKVGLVGASYNATNQWGVAAMHPPALVAIIPFATDQDGYRELAYPGGIYNENYRRWWFEGMVLTARPQGEGPYVDFLSTLKAHPFDGDFYTNMTDAPLGVDFDEITVPVMTAISQTMMLHGRAGIEVFNSLTVPKHLLIVDATYMSYMAQDTLEDQITFMDKYLRDREVELPAVRMIVRMGEGEIEWRQSDTWPLEGTHYRELYLDASGRSARWEAPGSEGSIEYSADTEAADPLPGAYFFSEPLTEDLELIGHFTAHLFVSSSTSDSDVYVALRVFDGDKEVHYPTREEDPKAPLTWGFLKTSHRATDPDKSTPERPWHTHTQGDYAPLRPGEIVEVNIEFLPATARVKAGQRFRVDVTAMEGEGGFQGITRVYDPAYHAGAMNTVHTGPEHPSWLTLPIVPRA